MERRRCTSGAALLSAGRMRHFIIFIVVLGIFTIDEASSVTSVNFALVVAVLFSE